MSDPVPNLFKISSRESEDIIKEYLKRSELGSAPLVEGWEIGGCWAGGQVIREVIDTLPHPAWLLNATGEVLHDNGKLLRKRRILGSEVAHLWGAHQLRGNIGRVSLKQEEGCRIDAVASVQPLLGRSVPEVQTTQVSLWLLMVCIPGEEIARDQALLSRALTHLMGMEVPLEGNLTPQQKAIFRLLVRNHSYKEIAAQLGVAHSTIRVQVAAMRRRLGEQSVPVLRRDKGE